MADARSANQPIAGSSRIRQASRLSFRPKRPTQEFQSHRAMRLRMSWPIRWPTPIRGWTRRSTGRRPVAFPALSVGSRPRRRGSHGHRAARRRARLAEARAELIRHTLDAAKGRPGVKSLLRRRYRSSRTGGRSPHRRDHPRLRRADRSNRSAWAGRLVVMASRALAAVAKSPDDYAKVYGRILAASAQSRSSSIGSGEMFDPALAGYWGSADHAAAMENLPRHHSRQRGKDRRRENLAALERQGNRDAAETADGRADVYRRRFQLCRTDRRRRRRAIRTRCSVFSTPSRPQLQRVSRGLRPATCKAFTEFSSRRCRCRGIFFRRRPGSTKPASYSSPGSMACRIISSWLAGRKAPDRCCILPNCSGWPTRRVCCTIPSSPRRA